MPTKRADVVSEFLDYIMANLRIPPGLEASVLAIRPVSFSQFGTTRKGVVIVYELPRGPTYGEFRTVLDDFSTHGLYRSINPTAEYDKLEERETAKQRVLQSLDKILEEQGFLKTEQAEE